VNNFENAQDLTLKMHNLFT